MALSGYIAEVEQALRRKDGKKLSSLIEINPSNNQGVLRGNFPEPTDFDLYSLDDKFRQVIKSYLKLMKSIYVVNDIKKCFYNYVDLVNNFNRAAVTETNWINFPLMKACKELVDIYAVMEKSFPEEVDGGQQHAMKISTLETLANTINNSFKLSLNDKNLDLSESKRIDIYFFLSCLIKIYFKLNNIELAKSIEKALKGTRFQLPALDVTLTDKYSAISYLYYSSILSLDDGDFTSTESKLNQALSLASYVSNKGTIKTNLERIFLILLPVKLLNSNEYPKKFIYKNYPILKYIYKDRLFQSVHKGDIALLNTHIASFEGLLLKKRLYLVFEKLKSRCYLNLIKKTTKIHQKEAKDGHIIPFNAFIIAFTYASGHSKILSFDQDQVECILANLIADGKIKGYLSHANSCIVLSKALPFP